jgi:CDP-diacylglycerol--serine O-phosphatidyltransferase
MGAQGSGPLGLDCRVCLLRCAALRLARFNVNTSVVDKRYFQGLPSPAAAALVAGFIWLMTELGVRRGEDLWLTWNQVTWIMFAFTLYAGLTMVTNVPFYSFKDVQMKKSVPFAVIVLIALGIAVINIHPPIVSVWRFCCVWHERLCRVCMAQGQGAAQQRDQHSTDEPDERGLHR